MQEIAYVKTERYPDEPPPLLESGPVYWLRTYLFNSWYNSVATLLVLYLLYLALPPLVDWLFISAIWEADNFRDCKAEGAGACWGFIEKRFGQFMYGRYDEFNRWRPNLAGLLFLLAMLPVLFTQLPGRKTCAVFLILVYPAVAILLIHGPVSVASMQLYRIDLEGNAFFNGSIFIWLTWLVAAVGLIRYALKAQSPTLLALGALLAYTFVFILFISDIFWGILDGLAGGLGLIDHAAGGALLPAMETETYGGLMLTLILAGTAIAVSLPLGVLLALGRRSTMPIIQTLCVVFIELIRSVPLITVLFMAQFMLPLFLPEGTNFDNVVRAMVGMSLFAAAYMAEVVRGGLQAIPSGQFEAADSLGLNFYLKMRLIVLPQALKIVIPGIVSTFIGLFKDTSLVSIIGLFDLLLVAKSSVTDSNWLGLEHTAYVFIALIYFIFCFGMSRYSIYLERKLHTGHQR